MSTSDDPGAPLLTDSRLTAMGLLIEAHAGVRSIVDAGLEDHGVTGSAFEVLIRLGRSPRRRLRMTELAEQSTLSNSGLTRVVDRLLANGYVKRVRDDRDKRVYYAVLTSNGIDQLITLLPSHLEAIDDALTTALSPDELDAFVGALRKIRASARAGQDAQQLRAG